MLELQEIYRVAEILVLAMLPLLTSMTGSLFLIRKSINHYRIVQIK